MHVPPGWKRKVLSLPLLRAAPKSICGARATSVESGCGSGATRAAVNRRSARAHVEGRVERARRAKFLPCSVHAVHNDAEPFGVDEIYERLDHRLSRSHRAAARGGFAPTAKRRLGRVRTPAHSNGNIPRPPRELRPREINRHESTAGA